MDYKKVANEIITYIGGVENIKGVKVCCTRVKIKYISSGKVELNKLESMKEIKGMFESNGYLNLIVGVSNPSKIFSYMEEAGVLALPEKETDIPEKMNDKSDIIVDMETLRKDLNDIFRILKKYI